VTNYDRARDYCRPHETTHCRVSSAATISARSALVGCLGAKAEIRVSRVRFLSDLAEVLHTICHDGHPDRAADGLANPTSLDPPPVEVPGRLLSVLWVRAAQYSHSAASYESVIGLVPGASIRRGTPAADLCCPLCCPLEAASSDIHVVGRRQVAGALSSPTTPPLSACGR
jgi:hypothetical protein